MSSIDVIENKISYIKKHLAKIKAYQHYTLEQIVSDAVVKSALERELYIAAQAAIDLAEAVVAYKNFRKPTTMREAFDILGEEKILPREFLEKFVGIVGFRNALAHDYEDLKIEVLYDVLHNKLQQTEEFLDYMQAVI